MVASTADHTVALIMVVKVDQAIKTGSTPTLIPTTITVYTKSNSYNAILHKSRYKFVTYHVANP